MLKRKWSVAILRYLEAGVDDASEIIRREPAISSRVMSERLRTMLRYGLIARFPYPAPSTKIVYRLTFLGKKILGLLSAIEHLDEQVNASRPVRQSSEGENRTSLSPDKSNSLLLPSKT
jgi:DNA-binding HxlR family transcriptional regulator